MLACKAWSFINVVNAAVGDIDIRRKYVMLTLMFLSCENEKNVSEFPGLVIYQCRECSCWRYLLKIQKYDINADLSFSSCEKGKCECL